MDEYYINFSGSIGNLKQGSPVNFMGVPVGSVTDLRVSKDLASIEAKIDLSKGTRITTGTRAKLKFSPLTNVYFIELTVNQGALGEDLAPGCLIPHEKTEVDEFVSSLPELQATIQNVLSKVSIALSAENLDNFNVFMKDAREVVGYLATDYPSIKKDLDGTLDDLRKSFRDFDTTLDKIRVEAERFTTDTREALYLGVDKVENGFARFNTSVDELDLKEQVSETRRAFEQVMTRLDQTVLQMKEMVSENRKEMRDLLKGLNDLSLQMRSFVRRLDDDPSRLIWSDPRPERSTPD
ncbi:MAG: MlaD family protein, partial [Planctomycetota bacterium]